MRATASRIQSNSPSRLNNETLAGHSNSSSLISRLSHKVIPHSGRLHTEHTYPVLLAMKWQPMMNGRAWHSINKSGAPELILDSCPGGLREKALYTVVMSSYECKRSCRQENRETASYECKRSCRQENRETVAANTAANYTGNTLERRETARNNRKAGDIFISDVVHAK
ncbi:hypothetical protein QE152_g4969 [Popillia japonica]|uniref:Uncharacterized protein n=1 Tax=Popillia japonica TaxID=7064 RepID=A0AAW1MYL7_POPJA